MKHHSAKQCAQGCTSSVFPWQGKIQNSSNKALVSQQPAPEGAGTGSASLPGTQRNRHAWQGDFFIFFKILVQNKMV